MVKAYIRCYVSAAGGAAYVVGKSDTATPPTVAVTGKVGIEAGLLGEDNTFEVSFIVAPGKTYSLSSTATNGTVTLGKIYETAF